jgi:lipopolysaccharide biosynthesis glycosyltransferase
MSVNLEKMRRENIYDEMIKYIKDKSNALLWLDQDVLNKFFYNDFIELPSVWNYHRFFVLNRGNNIKKIEMDNPVIIHYTGPIKPWDKNDSSVLKKKYDYYHEKLDFETNKKATNKRISLKEFVPIKFLKRVYHFLVKNKVFIYFLKVLNNFKAFRYLKYKLNEKIHFIPHQVIHSYSGVETSIDFIKIETNIIHGIDNILQLPSIIKINGWFLVPSRNITEFEKFNRYFSDEFDYSSSGFITIIDKEKIQEKDFSIGLLLIDKVTKETYFKTTETKISI